MKVSLPAQLLASAAVLFTSTLAMASPDVIFNARNRNKEFIVTGVELKDAHAPFANESKGYELTLNVLVGGNPCYAEQRAFDVKAVNDNNEGKTEVQLNYADANNKPCQDIYRPVYKELKVYVPSWQDYSIAVDTNTEELKDIRLLNSRENAIINSVNLRGVERIYGEANWVVVQFSANVLAGNNACEAANTRLHGYSYTYEGALRVAVASEKINPQAICPMNYDPVYKDIVFLGTVRLGSVNRVEVENAMERGAIQVLPLPADLR